MNQDYEIYRMQQRLYGHTLTQEDIKNWIYSNIFITRIGTVKEFKQQTQEAVVIIPEFEDLEIQTKIFLISALNYQKVILLYYFNRALIFLIKMMIFILTNIIFIYLAQLVQRL